MTVIELGDVGAPAPGPDGRETGPEFHPRSWRRPASLAVVLLCLLTFTASGRPGTPMVHEVWSIRPSGEFTPTVRADGVFVHQRTRDETELVAYEPATGAVRWRRAFDGSPAYVGNGEEAGLLLIPADEKVANVRLDDGSPGVVTYGGTTTAVDARTGDLLWRGPGELLDARADTLLLGERARNGDLVSIRLLRSRTGTVVWRRAVDGVEQLVVPPWDPAPSRLVTADGTGHVTVLDYSDGAVLAERPLPWTRSRPSRGVDTYLGAANGLLVVTRNQPERSAVAAYRLDSLDELWQTGARAYPYVQDCGPLLCIAQAAGLVAVEPLTGRQVWRLPGYSGATLVAEDRLLASGPGPEPAEQALLEPATGRRIGTGGAGWPTASPFGAESLVLMHRVFEGERVYSTVSHLDVRTGRLVRIGAIDGVDVPQCSSAGRYMACDQSGRLVITAFG